MADFDFVQFADRVGAAADRARGLRITVSGTDLILSQDGYGTNRSESVPFAALFLRREDVLAEALDRLDRHSSERPKTDAAPASGVGDVSRDPRRL